ncbi:MAG TPA: dTMP kinase [Anaerohalosphaeraceae bacterium]|jgi:dTMP kinase|nr:dTMP kinase [Anaerohalosphaeraceae bacterium]HRT51533.1 dTMP kinase [Anaerohalosphaeraceae bacterium]HRT87539.1 dTMP kinase [Anaerohalosphaeraceae bacterium]
MTADALKGRFIVLDGPDGCGKSTQVRLLAEWVRGRGVKAVGFRDPGDTAVGEKIRDILLDPEHVALGTRAEMLLYMAARAQLWEEKIGPALDAGACVVMDRWVSSTCAYQGCAGGFGIENVVRIAGDCLERVWPDLTIVLDVDEETAAARMNRQLDRMEQKGREYHRRVRQGYLELAQNYEAVVLLDAGVSIESLHAKVIETVCGRAAAGWK